LDAKSLIEVENLSKVYGEGDAAVEALKGISMNIEQSDFVAIMGPSGSGKSTLMHLIGCLDQATSGHYGLAGRSVETLDDDELADIRSHEIGFVFQQFNLLPRTSSLENVMLPLTYLRGPSTDGRKHAAELLRSVGLEHRIKNWPNELSGGEQQRVAIARSLINDPSIILADEPTGALDSKAGDEVMAIFKRLNEEGRTIVIITHERYIAEYSSRIIYLKDGRIETDERH
jgi:putative ABC transport system ATP-binding protein